MTGINCDLLNTAPMHERLKGTTEDARVAGSRSEAAMAHMTQPMAASNTRQADGRRNRGASQAAP